MLLLLLLLLSLLLLGSIAESDSTFCATCYHSMVCQSVCRLSHSCTPAKAVGWNEMPFGRDTRVVQSNIMLDRGPGPSMGRADLAVRTPSLQ